MTMKGLSDIANEYLRDFEILQDARLQLEKELADWWKVLVGEAVLPAMRQTTSSEIGVWDNQASPGYLQIHLKANTGVLLEITDPRNNGTRAYSIRIETTNSAYRKIRADQILLSELENVAAKKANGTLFPSGRRIADVQVDIDGSDPEMTLDKVRDTAQILFGMVEVIAKHI